MKTLILLGGLCWLTYAKEFRFDYEFSEEADGWLKYHVIPATWDEARLRCHAEGVPLLRLAITWAPGEPDNYNNSESCLVMLMDNEGVMADTRCDAVHPYVCYKKETQLTISACGTTDSEYTLDPRTGSCYKFHSTGLVWSEAYMTCVAEGGHLVIIDNDVEAALVTEIFGKHPEITLFSIYRNSLFVGAHDWGHHGNRFMTIHGEELGYRKWTDGQPDNVTRARSEDQGQFCVSVFRNGRYDDMFCNVPTAFLCEKDPNSLRLW